ncbi:hypothetical protein HDE68_002490 [Pedobacter cryoconitis]|uniref:O-antigen ligase-like membrane protein n=1 Tax=Pedobacter cryoconitis TaxID=188932 RepID=A0A7W8ZM84_9SPHI|nr:O-antigen ligase family protein [Pedobacter cryoconitis]MBB5636589.1 hypothetical protein [Pedobacter cryoconitis]
MRWSVNRHLILDKVFLFVIVILVPIFDSATGFLVRGETMSTSSGGLGTPSQLIRFVIIGLSILLIKSKSRYIILLLASLYLIIIESGSFIAHGSLQGYLIGVVFAYKFIFSTFVFFALDKVFKDLNYTEKDIIKFIYKSLLVLCISFVLGDVIALKVGISESFFRSSGLFSSGNGLGVLLGVCSMIMLYGSRMGYLNRRIHKVIYLLNLFCLLLISTKASGIFLVINLAFIIGKLPVYYKILVGIIVTIVLVVFYTEIINILSVAFELVIFRFENKSSWMNFIFSAREDYIDNAFNSFNQSGWKVFRIIFGAGSFLSYELPSDFTMKYKMMEMDSFDTFFMYGVLGMMVYLYLMFYCIIGAYRKNKMLGVTTIALFLHSMVAGHTMYNGLSAMGVVFMILLINSKKHVYKAVPEKQLLVANA